jgi:UDP-galactopyranose mutase
MYDYLIVGAGLFGCVFAEQAASKGARCLIIDKRDHIAGNCHTVKKEDFYLHMYGPHVFHTNSDRVWEYVNQFAQFNNFVNRIKSIHNGKIYSLPINLLTLNQFWGVTTPAEALKKLEEVRVNIENPSNLEEWAISQVGTEIYETLIYGYTKKQWQREPRELPASIIRRLPIRLTYDDNYYNAKYQGIPIDGYTDMCSRMIDNELIEVKLNTSFDNHQNWRTIARKLIFTGSPDVLFNYEYGELEYRTLKFYHVESEGDFQGNAIINSANLSDFHTRSIEHKHFTNSNSPKTVVTYESPSRWERGLEQYYPVDIEHNRKVYKKYKDKLNTYTDIVVGGRLGQYQYWDMDQTIASALKASKEN